MIGERPEDLFAEELLGVLTREVLDSGASARRLATLTVDGESRQYAVSLEPSEEGGVAGLATDLSAYG